MKLVSNRHAFGAAVCAAVLVAVLAVPAFAMASVPGDDALTAVQFAAFPWSQDSSGTLITNVDSSGTFYEYWNWFSLNKGQTVTFTGQADDEGFYMLALARDFKAPMTVGSDNVGLGVERLTLMAPKTGSYYLVSEGSKVETFSISGAIVPTVSYKLASFAMPSKAKKSAKFTATVNVLPDYNSLFSPVKFVVERKVGKKFRPYATYSSVIGGGNTSYTKFKGSIKITKKGTFRIHASFSDAAHKVQNTKPKTITIK